MLIIIFGILFLLIVIYWYLSNPNNLPPGPKGIPILGYLPWLMYYSNDRLALLDHLKQYGPIVCVRVGFNYMLFLNDLESIQNALIGLKEIFSGRGMRLMNEEITNGKGIMSTEGPRQREQRRFILKTLHNLGLGKKCLEEPIFESIYKLCEEINGYIYSNPNESLELRGCLTEALADNISKIVIGSHFTDLELKRFIKIIEEFQQIPPIFFLMNSFPFLKPLMNFNWIKRFLGIEGFKRVNDDLLIMLRKHYIQHKTEFEERKQPDFLFSYFDEQRRRQLDPKETSSWDDDQLLNVCGDLIGAGIGASETTISLILLAIAQAPEWQTKVQEEIDRVIGHGKPPTMADIRNMPLCEASILEAVRWAVVSPTTIPHSTLDSCHLAGYFIPKDCAVFPNLYEVFRCSATWKDPHNYNPRTNMLSEDGTTVINKSNVPFFGLGLRSCVGESLARMEIFLFFTALLQRYELRIDPQYGFPELFNSIFRIPKHRRILFKQRQNH